MRRFILVCLLFFLVSCNENPLLEKRIKTFNSILKCIDNGNNDSINKLFTDTSIVSYSQEIEWSKLMLSKAKNKFVTEENIITNDSTFSGQYTGLTYYRLDFYDSNNVYLGKIFITFYGDETEKIVHLFSWRKVKTIIDTTGLFKY